MDVIHRSKEQRFAFDYVFGREEVETIFRLCAKDIVEDSVNGYKGCIFAYGATGSGKTFTMMGGQQHQGMNERCLEVVATKEAHLREGQRRLRERLQDHSLLRRDIQRVYYRPLKAKKQRLPRTLG